MVPNAKNMSSSLVREGKSAALLGSAEKLVWTSGACGENRFTRWQRFSSPSESDCAVDVFGGWGGKSSQKLCNEWATALRTLSTTPDD